ncbi:MAG TPA: signal peptide peptidase SppA [Coriobacteriia bacterium]|nr:signal peptide peptidase SppA [Coriobacteriia bacterium]
MAEQGYPPVPPRDPSESRVSEQAVPPVAPPEYSGYAPKRRSRAWIWWVVGVAVVLLLIVSSCMLPFLFLGSDGLDVPGGNGIAVIHVDGVIAGTGDYYSGVVTPEYFLDILEQAEDDPNVKAIVLRVDSPGGTVAASEEIATYVSDCTKPVIVSVGDVGASGAYMISSQADEIWANPGSTVGSIGVIAEIPNVEELLGKVGVEFQIITAGKYKGAGSPYRPLTKQERALIQGEVEEAYGQFIDIVAEGRKLPRAEVEELATGWAWSGETAKKLGLVDEIGTYRDALEAAAEQGGIEGDYEVITYGDELDRLFGSLFSLTDQLGGLKSLSSRDTLTRQSLPK